MIDKVNQIDLLKKQLWDVCDEYSDARISWIRTMLEAEEKAALMEKTIVETVKKIRELEKSQSA